MFLENQFKRNELNVTTDVLQCAGVGDRMSGCVSSRYILLLTVCLVLLVHNTSSSPLETHRVSRPL